MATSAARRYARAVFEVAQADGRLAEWADRIAGLRSLLSDAQVATVLSNPTIAATERMRLVSDAQSELDAEAVNLAKLLIESNRVREIGGIAEEFERLSDESAGRVRALATTAIELDPAERDKVADELSKQLGKEVRLDVLVDPRVLGGLKLQYGDRVVDATVATRLQQLRRRLAAT